MVSDLQAFGNKKVLYRDYRVKKKKARSGIGPLTGFCNLASELAGCRTSGAKPLLPSLLCLVSREARIETGQETFDHPEVVPIVGSVQGATGIVRFVSGNKFLGHLADEGGSCEILQIDAKRFQESTSVSHSGPRERDTVLRAKLESDYSFPRRDVFPFKHRLPFVKKLTNGIDPAERVASTPVLIETVVESHTHRSLPLKKLDRDVLEYVWEKDMHGGERTKFNALTEVPVEPYDFSSLRHAILRCHNDLVCTKRSASY